MELKYQQSFVQALKDKYSTETDGMKKTLVLPDSDERVILVKKLVRQLQEACVYFSPECEEYMTHMEVIVVEDDEVNAYSAMGSILVVYTGILDYFMKLKHAMQITNIEEVYSSFNCYS